MVNDKCLLYSKSQGLEKLDEFSLELLRDLMKKTEKIVGEMRLTKED